MSNVFEVTQLNFIVLIWKAEKIMGWGREREY